MRLDSSSKFFANFNLKSQLVSGLLFITMRPVKAHSATLDLGPWTLDLDPWTDPQRRGGEGAEARDATRRAGTTRAG
jgi:hypothetical protein